MKKATITQLKNELSELLEIVRRGGSILIFDRNIPIARIVSVVCREYSDQASEARLAKLERAELARRGDSKKLQQLANRSKPVKMKRQVRVLEMMIDEREEGF